MDEFQFISLIDRCKSEDNDVRSQAELERDQLIQNDPLLFVNSLLQLIVSNSHQNLSDFMVVILFSVIKRAQTILSQDLLQNFFENLHSNIQNLLNRSTSQSIICSTYALTLSNLHKFPEIIIDFNSILLSLQTLVQPQYLLLIISEAIENSSDLCNFDINLLYEIIEQNKEHSEIIRLYFSIIGKLQENEYFVNILPNILEKITLDNVYSSFDAINAFCELGSPFMSYVYLNLANFIYNFAINHKEERIQANSVLIISAITIDNTKYVVNSPEFVDIIFNLFIHLINQISYDKLDNDSENEVFSIINVVTSQITHKLLVMIIEKIPEYFEAAINNLDILCGLLILLSISHPYLIYEIIAKKTKFDAQQLILQLIDETNPNIRYSCMRYLSAAIPSTGNETIAKIFQHFLELDLTKEEPFILYWIINLIMNICMLIQSRNEELFEMVNLCKEKMIELIEYISNSDEFDFVLKEKCIEKIIEIITKCIKLIPDPIDDVCIFYRNIFNLESHRIKETVVKQIINIFANLKNSDNEDYISEQAFNYYNVCQEMINNDEYLPPIYRSLYMVHMINLFEFLKDRLDDNLMDLYKNCYENLSIPFQFNEETQLNVFDLTVYYVADSISSNIKYTIEKTTVEILLEYSKFLYRITKKGSFYQTLENDKELFDGLIQLCLLYLNSDIFIQEIFLNYFQILFYLYQNIQNQEMQQEIIGILIEQYIKLTNLDFSGQTEVDFLFIFTDFIKICIDHIQENDNVKQSSVNLLIKILQNIYNNASEIQKSEKTDVDKFSQWEALINPLGSHFLSCCLSFAWQLRKYCPELLVDPFTEKIFPLVCEYADSKFISSFNLSLLVFYFTFSEDGRFYAENRQILFNYFGLLYQNEDEEDYDTDDLDDQQDNWIEPYNDLLFISLCIMIKYINLTNDLLDELFENLISLRDNSCNEIASGDLASAILMIYRKYPDIINQDFTNNFDYMQSCLVDRYSSITFNTLYFDVSLSMLENYIDLFEQDYNDPSGDTSMIESVFEAWATNINTIVKNYKDKLEKVDIMFGRFFNLMRVHKFLYDFLKKFWNSKNPKIAVFQKHIATFLMNYKKRISNN